MSQSEATKYAAKTVRVATVRLLVESRQVTTDSVSQMRDQSEASKYAAETVTQVSTFRQRERQIGRQIEIQIYRTTDKQIDNDKSRQNVQDIDRQK